MSENVSDTYDPEHDPLCWYADKDKIAAAAVNDGRPCVCDLIARVRLDTAARNYNNGFDDGYAAALCDAVEAVKEVEYDADSSAELERDYDVDPTGQTRNPRIWVREAVAAIEELGADR